MGGEEKFNKLIIWGLDEAEKVVLYKEYQSFCAEKGRKLMVKKLSFVNPERTVRIFSRCLRFSHSTKKASNAY